MVAYLELSGRKRIPRLSDPGRSILINCGKRQQEALVIETGKYDLHLGASVPISPGTSVAVEVATGFPVEMRRIPGFVHWANAKRGSSVIGVAFPVSVPPDLIIAADGSLRSNLRFPCKVSGHLSLEQDAALMPATAINYSRNGMCLQTSFKCEIGENLQYSWQGPAVRSSSPQKRTVRSIVRWVSAVGDSFLLGCETAEDCLWPLSQVDVGDPTGICRPPEFLIRRCSISSPSHGHSQDCDRHSSRPGIPGNNSSARFEVARLCRSQPAA